MHFPRVHRSLINKTRSHHQYGKTQEAGEKCWENNQHLELNLSSFIYETRNPSILFSLPANQTQISIPLCCFRVYERMIYKYIKMLNCDRLTYDSLLKQCSGLYQICGPEDIKSITILSSSFWPHYLNLQFQLRNFVDSKLPFSF